VRLDAHPSAIAVKAVIYQKRQELAGLSPGEFLFLTNTSIWWASADSRHRSPSKLRTQLFFLRTSLHLTPTDNLRPQQIRLAPTAVRPRNFPENLHGAYLIRQTRNNRHYSDGPPMMGSQQSAQISNIGQRSRGQCPQELTE
jgi:hypothetical protein